MLTDLCKEGNSVFAKDMGDSPVAKMMAEFESDPDHPPTIKAGLAKRTVKFNNAKFPDPPPELVLQRGKPSSLNSFLKCSGSPSLVSLAQRFAEFDNSFCKCSEPSS